MSLAPGTAIGPYTIVAAIGAGGMGEVYRATDSRLGRDVAIKVLPDEVANQPDRLARFEREARALAALNHFNVAQVYGFEGRALVMELLEGETLRQRLSHGALPIRKAIEYAMQMARGLAAAHDRGIIHRDLKPENVFIVSDGHIKILDFGLARRDSDNWDIETKTARHSTAPGTVLGTVGYMSPEPVRGQTVDARSDLFSLGAVLYEMLTGTQAFRRESSADTMAAVLNEHPRDLTSLRGDAGPALDRIVQHCLEKNPVERFQSARDVAFALEALSGSALSMTAATSRQWPLERIAWAGLTVLLIAVLGWQLTRERNTPMGPPPVSRTLLPLPEGIAVNEVTFQGMRLALSPDGTKVVFHARDMASGQSQLFLLPLDGSAATPLQGTDEANGVFWSPDSREIIFSTRARLMRLPLGSGQPLAVTKDAEPFFGAGAWSTAGVAVVGGPALREVSVADGEIRVLQKGDGDSYAYPRFLPDGRRFVFNRFAASGDIELQAGRVGSSDSHLLLKAPDLGNAQYASGMLVYTRGATIFAQHIDREPPDLVGEPVAIGGPVEAGVMRGAAFAVSNTGVLVYQQIMREAMNLTWLDRKGATIGTVSDVTDYANVELSGDNRRALVSITDPRVQTRDVFIIDLARGVRQRFTTDPSDERSSVWSPDSRRVLYTSKGLNFYARAADSSDDERGVIVDQVSKDPYDWSRDGRWLLYRRSGPGTGSDVWMAPADGSSAGRALVATRFTDIPGTFSPDGRFIVYTSDESGQPEVYAMNVDGGGKTQLSTKGGVFPIWRGDGREIVYISTDRTLMSAAVTPGKELNVSAAVPLFKINVSVSAGRMYDVTPDGSRFLAAIPVPSRIPPSFTVVTNWPRLLDPN